MLKTTTRLFSFAHNLKQKKNLRFLCSFHRNVKTAYVFTGQGSTTIGMGLQLYNNSSTIKKLWGASDRFLKENYGFSIIEIIRENPKTLKYNFENKPIELKSEEGALFATQFSQVALSLLEYSIIVDLKERNMLAYDHVFAGHSLGEYPALSSLAQIMDLNTLLDVVFQRGMIMQRSITRDSLGRSPYGMIAVFPQKVSDLFTIDELNHVIDQLSSKFGRLIQIVNFNSTNQYVVAGDRWILNILTGILNEGKKDEKLLLKNLDGMIDKIQTFNDPGHSDPYSIKLIKGSATLPLKGIDVPFHSKLMSDGVPTFRAVLSRNLSESSLDPNLLIDRYFSNVLPRPFSLSRSYVESLYSVTGSAKLLDLLGSYPECLDRPRNLCLEILLEILGFQFASPVRWVEVIDAFVDMGVCRLVEVGPAPVLSGLAKSGRREKFFQDVSWVGESFSVKDT